MTSVNKIFLIGNLVRDPELRTSPFGALRAEFTLAVETLRMDEGEPARGADYFPVQVWGSQGRATYDRLCKGSLVHLEGQLKQKRWKDDATRKRHARLVVVATRVTFLARLREGPPPGLEASSAPAPLAPSRLPVPGSTSFSRPHPPSRRPL